MNVSKLLLAIAMLAVACTTEQTPIDNNVTETDIAKIGSQISRETADVMIENTTSSLRPRKMHIYGKTMLKEILSMKGTEGIYIINGMDSLGEIRLIFRAADAKAVEMADDNYYDDGMVCPPSCPKENISSIGKRIEAKQAEEWIKSFRSANTKKAYSFLFGRDVFNQLLSQKGVAGIAFINGIKSTGQDAMVLVGVTETGEILWDGDVYDDGAVCPPNCPSK